MFRKKRPAERIEAAARGLAETSRERLQEVAGSSRERLAEVAESSRERLQEAALDLAEAFPPTAEWAARRRRRGGWVRFLLGLVAGAGTGAGLGFVVGAPGGGTGAAGPVQATIERARQAFARGRASVLERGHGGASATGGVVSEAHAAPAGAHTAVAAPAGGALAPVRGALDGVKARWREAVAAGKEASAEKQAEMRRRYLEDTQRV